MFPRPHPLGPTFLLALAPLALAAQPGRPAAAIRAPHAAGIVAPSTIAGRSTAEIVERRVAVMGTILTIEVEAATRAQALAASETALAAIEAAQARLSTWRADSELALLNRAPAGQAVAITRELEVELEAALHWSRETGGAFDPAVGGLVRAWGLRSGGRVPSTEERSAAFVAGGGATNLVIERGRATRLDARLCLEEGGFGKGAGLDAALRALEHTEALAARLDLGGQVAFHARNARDRADQRVEVADPLDRAHPVVALRVADGSISTSGNSAHGIVVAGVRYGHILDPRSGEPARDFGSLTVWAGDATAADCLSTGLYVLGPERALAFAAEHTGIEVLVIETAEDGRTLRARASRGLAGRIESLDQRLSLAFPDDAARTAAAQRDTTTPTLTPR